MDKSRVVIENISPLINNGRYAAKRTAGEKAIVNADLLADGHEHLGAVVEFKRIGDRKWDKAVMSELINDQWEASFICAKEGIYEFRIRAWIDPLGTWLYDLRKKIDASLDVSLELLIANQLMTEGISQVVAGDKKRWQELADMLKDEEHYTKAVTTMLDPETAAFLARNPIIKDPVVSDTFLIRVEPVRALFSAWYEIFPRSASGTRERHGTFADCEKLLPMVEDLGFDVIYFPPIHPIGRSFRKGRNNSTTALEGEPGSPWAIGSAEGGHKAIHPELGTAAEFRTLVKAAKKRGIDIALDLAYQCSQDHPYVKEHPQWFKWRPDGTVQYAENPPKKYQDVLPINFETDDWKALWKELKSIVDHWISQGVRIFRVDNPHTKPFNFWEWLIAEVHLEHPDIIFLSEAFTRPKVMQRLAKIGFTQSYTYFTWRSNKKELEEYMTELTQSNMRNYFRPNFWPNTPDILAFQLQNAPEPAFIIRYVLAATLSSNYGVYAPAYDFCINDPVPFKEEYHNSEKYEIKPWNWKTKNKMRSVMKAVNRIRNENPALQNTWNILFCQNDSEQLISYLKYSDDRNNMIYVCVNLHPEKELSAWTTLPLEFMGIEEGRQVQMEDLVMGNTYTWSSRWNYVGLDPNVMPFHIFRLSIEN